MTFATMCSGSEMVSVVMKKLSVALGLEFDQLFSCELHKGKRQWGEAVVEKAGYHSCCSFSDVSLLAAPETACSKHGAICPVNRVCGVITGLSCKDLSVQNPRRPGTRGQTILDASLIEVSTTAKTFCGLMSFVDAHAPDWLVIENSDQLLENADGDAQACYAKKNDKKFSASVLSSRLVSSLHWIRGHTENPSRKSPGKALAQYSHQYSGLETVESVGEPASQRRALDQPLVICSRTQCLRVPPEALLETLQSRAYCVHTLLIDSTSFGVPQRRRRSYVIGILKTSTLLDDFNEHAWREKFDALMQKLRRTPPFVCQQCSWMRTMRQCSSALLNDRELSTGARVLAMLGWSYTTKPSPLLDSVGDIAKHLRPAQAHHGGRRSPLANKSALHSLRTRCRAARKCPSPS